MKKKTIIGFVLATVIMVLVFFHFLDFGEIISAIRTANPYFYLMGIVCIVVHIVSMAFRWKTVINTQGYDLRTRNILGNLVSGLAVNQLTPFGKVGGETLKAYLLKKRNGVNYSDGLASALADGSILLIGTTIFIFFSLILVPFVMDPPSWLLVALGGFLIVVGLFLVTITGVYRDSDYMLRFIKFLTNKIGMLRKRKEEILEKYIDFRKSFRRSLENKKSLLKALSAVGLGKFLDIASYFFIFLALGTQVPLIHIFVVVGIVYIILFVPITPGSLGLYEGVFVSVFVLLGVNPSIAASAVLLQRLISYWAVIAIGGYLGTYYGIKITGERKKPDME